MWLSADTWHSEAGLAEPLLADLDTICSLEQTSDLPKWREPVMNWFGVLWWAWPDCQASGKLESLSL